MDTSKTHLADQSGLKLTKFGHACIRLDHQGHRIVIDPGSFTDLDRALPGAEHILITHEHADHIDDDPVLDYLVAHVEVHLYGPESVIERLRERIIARKLNLSEKRLVIVGADEEFSLPGFQLRTVGGQHEVIHPQIPVVANVGFIINELVYHPGDSYVVPTGTMPHTVLVPLSAPWSKLSDMLDFIIAVRPTQVIPVHDGLLNHRGLPMYRRHAGNFSQRYGTALSVLEEGEYTWIN